MFYIIGTKEARDDFTGNNRIPYFDYEEDMPDMAHLYGQDDERVCLYANLDEGMYTVQIMSSDGVGIAFERDFGTYDEALAVYEYVEGNSSGNIDWERLMSVQEAAEALGVNRQRIHQLIESCRLSAAKIGGTWIVDGASVQARKSEMAGALTSKEWAKLGHDLSLFYDAWSYGAGSPSAASLADDFDDVSYVLDVDTATLKRRAASYFSDPSVAEWVERTMPDVDWDYIIGA